MCTEGTFCDTCEVIKVSHMHHMIPLNVCPFMVPWAHLSLSVHVFYENFRMMLAYSRIRQQEIICSRMLARPERWWKSKLNWPYTGRRWAPSAVLEIFIHTVVVIRVNVSVVCSSIGAGTPTDWIWCQWQGKRGIHEGFLSANWRLLAVTKRNLVKKKGLHWKRPSDCFAGMLQTPVVCTEDANFSSDCKKV